MSLYQSTKKVRIQCVTDGIKLLHFYLKKGDVCLLTKQEMKQEEVQRALRFHAIEVCEMINGPKKKKARASIKIKKSTKKKSFASIKKNEPASINSTNPTNPTNPINPTKTQESGLRQKDIDTIVSRVVSALQQTIQQIPTQTTNQRDWVDQYSISNNQGSPQNNGFNDEPIESTPMFIPRGIVSDELHGEMQLKTTIEVETGAELEDVAKALRNLRKGKE